MASKPVLIVDNTHRPMVDDRPDLTLTFAEREQLDADDDLRLTAWFRKQKLRVAIAIYIVGVAVGCYFAFQLGRGAF